MKKYFLVPSLYTLFLMVPFIAAGQRDWTQATIHTTGIADGIYRLFVDDRVAVVAQTGDDGILLIDAAYEQTVPQLKESIAGLSLLPLRFLINTHIHGDHTGGNLGLGQDVDIISHHQVREFLGSERRQGDRTIPSYPEYALPNVTFSDELHMQFNGGPIMMKHLPGGHTNSDILIYFPNSKVLVVGDLLFADNFPFIDVNNGGNPLVFLNNIEWIMNNYPQDIAIVGGHGPVYTMQQYRDYHQTLLKTLEVIRSAKSSGLHVEKIKEERLLKEWESMGRFFITEDRWIDTLYPHL